VRANEDSEDEFKDAITEETGERVKEENPQRQRFIIIIN